jgi:large subunit ribosomal protein L24
MHVKKGDKVIVLAGKDKGKTGVIIKSIPKEDRVVIEGVHLAKMHEKSSKGKGKGTIVQREMPVHVSNVKKVDAKKKTKKSSK